MSFDKIQSFRSSDRDLAQRTAKTQLDFVTQNLSLLPEKHKFPAANFSQMAKRGETFSPAQLSYIDGMYEKVMKKMGLGGADVKHDNKKSLRF